MAPSEDKPSCDIRQLVVGSVFESLEAFLDLCRGQNTHYKVLPLADVKEVASCHFPGKRIWEAVEVVILEDPHRYVFWLEHVQGHLRIASVERLTSAGPVAS